MKNFDIVAAVLLVIGGLNWGLVGLFDFNLVTAITGSSTLLATIVYAAVGAAAIYQVLSLRAIQRRWNVAPVRVS